MSQNHTLKSSQTKTDKVPLKVDSETSSFGIYQFNSRRKTDWRELLGTKTIEGKWAAFRDKLVACEAQFVPKRKCINRRLKPVWMTYQALKCLKRKHRTFSKCKRVDHPAYVKAAKSAKSELCKARHNFETKLPVAQKIKSDKKSFFACVRSGTRCRKTLGPLVNRDGTVIEDPEGMAEEFNTFFTSVFTQEDLSGVPQRYIIHDSIT